MKQSKQINIKESNVPSRFSFIENNRDLIFWILFGVTALFGFLLFNARVDEGGDDSSYICRAIDFLSDGRYPAYQGPLYPMFLSIFISLFGAKLLILKLTSLALILLSQYLFYRILRGKISTNLLLSVIALLSINSIYLFFASQTYSEAFFIVMEYIFFGAIMKYEVSNNKSLLRELKSSIPSGFMIFICMIIRTIGLGFGIVGIVYFCIRKKYKKAIMMLLSFFVFTGIGYGVRSAIWGDVDGGQSQLESLMQKHPYDKEKGAETFGGFVERFVDNSELYISKHFIQIIGFKEPGNRETSSIITIIVYLVFGYGAIIAYKKNRYIFFMALCSALMLAMTFIILQSLWDQVRLIIPFVGMALATILYGMQQIFKFFSESKAYVASLCILSICLLFVFKHSVQKIDINALKNNLKGDMLYGYTPDWYHYLDMCRQAAEKLPEDAYIACRKPNMARIYGNGRKFYGIYNFDTENADELIDQLYDKKVTHIILANLRRDPAIPRAEIINTIHRYMNYICAKYPEAFKLIYQLGDQNDEPAYLFVIDYDYVNNIREQQNQS